MLFEALPVTNLPTTHEPRGFSHLIPNTLLYFVEEPIHLAVVRPDLCRRCDLGGDCAVGMNKLARERVCIFEFGFISGVKSLALPN